MLESWRTIAVLGVGVILVAWALIEVGLRVAVGWSLETDFYGSISRDDVRAQQERHGVQVAEGPGWAHLGWIADPERERYRIDRRTASGWETVARVRHGSLLVRVAGRYRVRALSRRGGEARVVGEAEAEPEAGCAPLHVPRIAGAWRLVFRPTKAGFYVNDHAIFRDAAGRFRLLGITDRSRGDFDAERRFAHGVSERFPPDAGAGMREEEPVADFGELAWAPFVVKHSGRYHLFWSPHRLEHMTSEDGVRWEGRRTAIRAPMHRFFRDASIVEVAPGQWLLHATGRGRWFSRVDAYQSFDLEGWQYIGPALRFRPGSERNSAFASTETPSVTRYEGRWYLTVTCNNDSRFWAPLLLLLRRWPDPPTYNDTLVLHADNPYRFGDYRGRRRTSSLIATLETHAPRLLRHPETGAWWITTAGWPWAATLTSGEVATAPIVWEGPKEVLREPPGSGIV